MTRSAQRSHPTSGSSLSSKDRGLTTRLAAIAGAATAFVVLFSGTALAHPRLTSSDPAAGSTVSTPPSQVHTEYSEAIVAGSYMEVTDPCGRSVNSGETQVGTTSMDQAISAEAAGTYTVFWQANGADGHPVQGDFTFTSSGGSPCPGEEPEEKDPATGGGGNPGGSGGSGGSSTGSDPGSGNVASTTGGDDSSSANSNGSGNKHANHRKGSNGGGGNGKSKGSDAGGGATGPLAGARTDVPDAPSAIEGIPIDGLVITLVIAALIGAAAGKIYVSLSGDES